MNRFTDSISPSTCHFLLLPAVQHRPFHEVNRQAHSKWGSRSFYDEVLTLTTRYHQVKCEQCALNYGEEKRESLTSFQPSSWKSELDEANQLKLCPFERRRNERERLASLLWLAEFSRMF